MIEIETITIEIIFIKLTSFFCLNTKKRSKKKIKTAPASLEKLALEQLNRPNSQLRCSNNGRFLTLFLLIFRLTGRGRSGAQKPWIRFMEINMLSSLTPERCSGLTNFALSGCGSIIENTRVRPEGAIYTSPTATPWGYINGERIPRPVRAA